jgi:hypothetical protein
LDAVTLYDAVTRRNVADLCRERGAHQVRWFTGEDPNGKELGMSGQIAIALDVQPEPLNFLKPFWVMVDISPDDLASSVGWIPAAEYFDRVRQENEARK